MRTEEAPRRKPRQQKNTTRHLLGEHGDTIVVSGHRKPRLIVAMLDPHPLDVGIVDSSGLLCLEFILTAQQRHTTQ